MEKASTRQSTAKDSCRRGARQPWPPPSRRSSWSPRSSGPWAPPSGSSTSTSPVRGLPWPAFSLPPPPAPCTFGDATSPGRLGAGSRRTRLGLLHAGPADRLALGPLRLERLVDVGPQIDDRGHPLGPLRRLLLRFAPAWTTLFVGRDWGPSSPSSGPSTSPWSSWPPAGSAASIPPRRPWSRGCAWSCC